MNSEGLSLLYLHHPDVVQILGAGDHGVRPGIDLGLFDDVGISTLNQMTTPARQVALLENQSSGPKDSSFGIDLTIDHIAADNV